MNEAQLNEVLANLEGTSEILHFEEEVPIVFLFDEEHHNMECKRANIRNALSLINEANILLIGLESRLGGRNWSEKNEEYDDERYNLFYNCEFKEFEEALMINHPEKLTGVESIGMRTKILDLWGKGEIDQHTMPDHYVNMLRSKHFIRTLFEEYRSNHYEGNLLLNCGQDHNTHIANWIVESKIDKITGQRASYVSINTIV
jgi:hypothetical protein